MQIRDPNNTKLSRYVPFLIFIIILIIVKFVFVKPVSLILIKPEALHMSAQMQKQFNLTNTNLSQDEFQFFQNENFISISKFQSTKDHEISEIYIGQVNSIDILVNVTKLEYLQARDVLTINSIMVDSSKQVRKISLKNETSSYFWLEDSENQILLEPDLKNVFSNNSPYTFFYIRSSNLPTELILELQDSF